MNSFLLTTWALCALFILRGEIVKRRHIRRLHEIHAENLAAIENGTDTPAMFDRYASVGGFFTDMLDLRKWTYAQFYPEPSNDR